MSVRHKNLCACWCLLKEWKLAISQWCTAFVQLLMSWNCPIAIVLLPNPIPVQRQTRYSNNKILKDIEHPLNHSSCKPFPPNLGWQSESRSDLRQQNLDFRPMSKYLESITGHAYLPHLTHRESCDCEYVGTAAYAAYILLRKLSRLVWLNSHDKIVCSTAVKQPYRPQADIGT